MDTTEISGCAAPRLNNIEYFKQHPEIDGASTHVSVNETHARSIAKQRLAAAIAKAEGSK